MHRRTAALAAAATVLLTAMTGFPSSGAGGAEGPGARDRVSGPDPSTSSGRRGLDQSGTGDRPGARDRSKRLGQTPYQRRLFESRNATVNLGSAVGNGGRPNILVLMTDDMRDDDMQFMPNVRRLIGDQGVRFTNMFSPHPLCCPARASFLTGQYSHNHEVWSHKPPYGFQVFDDSETFPRWLHDDYGYNTSFLGKYLNGYGRMPLPDGTNSLRYIPPGWTDWRGAVDHTKADGSKHLTGGTYRYFDTTLSNNGVLEPHQGRYQPNLYSDITQEMIRKSARSPRPFLIYTSFTTPHTGAPDEKDDPKPVTRSDGETEGYESAARPRWVRGRFDHRITRIPPFLGDEDVSDKPAFIRDQPPLLPEEEQAILEDYRQRVEALSVVDDEVANIIRTLRRSGELDNTYVAFTSDNGYFLGEHRRRVGKILPYDPSLRVPLVMRGPGIPAGEERTDPFLMVDFAATFLDAAGGRARRDIDGTSMLDVARSGDRGWRRPIFTESGPRAVTDDLLKRVELIERRSGPSSVRFSQGVRTGRYLYVEHATRDKELYDMRSDPRQFVNVVDRPRYRTVVRLLAEELDRLRECDGPECARPLPRRLWTDDPVPPVRWDPAGGPLPSLTPTLTP